MASQQVMYGQRLWSRLAEQAVRGPRMAAVAYVGSQAEQLVPFGAGDLLVVDASPVSLRSGLVNPDTIEAWLNAGATIGNLPGLHAKTYVFGRTAIIGSANLSRHSRDQLTEAALVSTDRAVVRQCKTMVEKLYARSRPLTQLDMAALRQEYRPPRGGAPAGRRGPSRQELLPPGDFQLWVVDTDYGPKLSAANARALAKPHADWDSLYRNRFELDELVLDDGDQMLADPKQPMVLVMAYDDDVFSPARVDYVVQLRSGQSMLLMRTDPKLRPIQLRAAKSAVRAVGSRWRLNAQVRNPQARAALLQLWGLHE